jgi:ribosomal protein L16/L10AE
MKMAKGERIKIGKFNVLIIEENKPSKQAIENTNRTVNQIMQRKVG